MSITPEFQDICEEAVSEIKQYWANTTTFKQNYFFIQIPLPEQTIDNTNFYCVFSARDFINYGFTTNIKEMKIELKTIMNIHPQDLFQRMLLRQFIHKQKFPHFTPIIDECVGIPIFPTNTFLETQRKYYKILLPDADIQTRYEKMRNFINKTKSLEFGKKYIANFLQNYYFVFSGYFGKDGAIRCVFVNYFYFIRDPEQLN